MTGVPDLTAMLSVIDSEARTRDDIFTGPTLPTPHGRAFGGQVLGQALAAAGETAPEGACCIRCTATSCEPARASTG